MRITINSQIYIENPTREIENYIKKELSIPNPELIRKSRMGFSTWNCPKVINMYSKRGNNYIIPIGEIDNVWKLHPYKEDYIVNFGVHEKLDFPQNTLKLYDYQEKAVEKMLSVKRGILSSRCGSGKSIMALELIRRIGYKALIICEKKEILNQFIDYLKNDFNMSKGQYGEIKEGKVEIGDLVTVALRQTLAKTDLAQYKYEWGTIICDEGQNVRSEV